MKKWPFFHGLRGVPVEGSALTAYIYIMKNRLFFMNFFITTTVPTLWRVLKILTFLRTVIKIAGQFF